MKKEEKKEKQDERIEIRVTAEEKKKIKQKAEDHKMSVSQFLVTVGTETQLSGSNAEREAVLIICSIADEINKIKDNNETTYGILSGMLEEVRKYVNSQVRN